MDNRRVTCEFKDQSAERGGAASTLPLFSVSTKDSKAPASIEPAPRSLLERDKKIVAEHHFLSFERDENNCENSPLYFGFCCQPTLDGMGLLLFHRTNDHISSRRIRFLW
jgi:hypothetical protein